MVDTGAVLHLHNGSTSDPRVHPVQCTGIGTDGSYERLFR